ncbi:transcription antitermination factor NusB [Clostridium sp. 'White wine YQ']|uniref:transcription antitermination factor NusB n=1 Tax=Clostridium sp. 'White wine YQ' TaxID=3027474 RepID=UPI002366AD40|nr:transcription antitermination factor NusB [Clostridium sp. 'White wine YQ']MDD7793937.1 transcription antitermination factor NusB [Clostridium sp. 'White wine YQ']
MNRKKSRKVAMELCYSMEISKESPEEIFESFLDNYNEDKTVLETNYILDILNLVNAHKEEIDKKIEPNLRGWKLDRISKVNLSILRIAVAEILFIEDIPNKVSINEALELTKEYSDEKSVSFVNGVLDSINKEI